MGITAREDIAVGLNEIQDSKDQVFGYKTIQFAHKFTGGETSLDLLNLTTPSELSSSGFVNASPTEIAAAHLSVFKKNLSVSLSRGPSGLELKPFAHYITSGNQITFIGNLRDSGGAQAGEILFGEIVTVPTNSIVVGDVRWIRGTRIISVGQTLINIGYPYKIGENESEGQVGVLKLKRNGVSIYRNIGNATASPSADGNFHEDDSGNGYGTTATLNVAPVGQSDLIEFEVGIQISSGDMGLWSALEAMEGSIIKLSDDAAYNFYGDTDLSRYIATSPSAIERRAFGDLLTSAIERIVTLETRRQEIKYDGRAGFGSSATHIPFFSNVTFNNLIGAGLLSVINDSTNGFAVVASIACKVFMTFQAKYTGTGEVFGISRNASSLTAVTGLPHTQKIAYVDDGGRGDAVSARLNLSPGDILRPHVANISNLGAAGDWLVLIQAEG